MTNPPVLPLSLRVYYLSCLHLASCSPSSTANIDLSPPSVPTTLFPILTLSQPEPRSQLHSLIQIKGKPPKHTYTCVKTMANLPCLTLHAPSWLVQSQRSCTWFKHDNELSSVMALHSRNTFVLASSSQFQAFSQSLLYKMPHSPLRCYYEYIP